MSARDDTLCRVGHRGRQCGWLERRWLCDLPAACRPPSCEGLARWWARRDCAPSAAVCT